ncbi:hypothetical protein CWI75_02745 [Kineobactrum sediminis]|uniref:DUF4124 domain-containing protein n=1 Tax=Kineobactrum sediminis TaxID=1905677 RepID=A0A2N5Y7B2_9GAMM|nr:DUF4124 domain-containing protein [Kineobactrum sediminis]PLW84275.1 hypothetical protein CWI75_02745 [Kineobactrum sediminis]
MTRIPLFLLLLILPALAQAQIYKSVDEQGNVSYSDQPPEDGKQAEKLELPPTNTAPALETRPRQPGEQPEEPAPEPTVTIVTPENDTVIPMGPGNFSVQASVTPALRSGEQLQLSIDGKPYGETQTTTRWSLTGMFRGGYDLEVVRLDADGDVVARSDTVRVYVMRPYNIPNARGSK